jgi:oxygen-independent coproporphyrinogen III oxidase
MTTTNNLGIYVHIPFCVRKCRYCDFLSFSCSSSKVFSEYTDALIREIKLRSDSWHYRNVDSIYIGGGTPSLFSEWDMGRIVDCLKENFNVTDDAEITIEANPATLSDEKMKRYLRKGINRLSIGVQSFDNHVLGVLGRIHNKNDAFYAFQRARKVGFENINLDLMFAIPGQTMKMWKDTVRQCLFLKPSHISLYSLQIEEGTEFYRMIYEKGEMEPVPEIIDREMYHTALKMMSSAGYEHYEISNCALPGYRSSHNMKYWSYDEYLGMGLGASSFLDGARLKNHDKMYDYINDLNHGKAPVDEEGSDRYSPREEMGIYVFTGLRKAEGISLEAFRRTFHEDFFRVYNVDILNKYKGMLILSGDRLYLSSRGIDISNRIMMEFI